MELSFHSTVKFNKLMSKILWDENFMSSSEKSKYLWANKLLGTSFKEYGIKVRIAPDSKGKLELTYTFFLKRKFIPILKKYHELCKTESLENTLSNVGVQVTPAVVNTKIYNKTMSVTVVVPLLPYTNLSHVNTSIAKYRDIVMKRLALC